MQGGAAVVDIDAHRRDRAGSVCTGRGFRRRRGGGRGGALRRRGGWRIALGGYGRRRRSGGGRRGVRNGGRYGRLCSSRRSSGSHERGRRGRCRRGDRRHQLNRCAGRGRWWRIAGGRRRRRRIAGRGFGRRIRRWARRRSGAARGDGDVDDDAVAIAEIAQGGAGRQHQPRDHPVGHRRDLDRRQALRRIAGDSAEIDPGRLAETHQRDVALAADFVGHLLRPVEHQAAVALVLAGPHRHRCVGRGGCGGCAGGGRRLRGRARRRGDGLRRRRLRGSCHRGGCRGIGDQVDDHLGAVGEGLESGGARQREHRAAAIGPGRGGGNVGPEMGQRLLEAEAGRPLEVDDQPAVLDTGGVADRPVPVEHQAPESVMAPAADPHRLGRCRGVAERHGKPDRQRGNRDGDQGKDRQGAVAAAAHGGQFASS